MFNLSALHVILLAVMAESIWETLMMLWKKDQINTDRLGALLVAVIIAISTGIDLFAVVGIPIKINYLGSIFTGVLASRGSNFIHDLLVIAERVKVNNKIKVD